MIYRWQPSNDNVGRGGPPGPGAGPFHHYVFGFCARYEAEFAEYVHAGAKFTAAFVDGTWSGKITFNRRFHMASRKISHKRHRKLNLGFLCLFVANPDFFYLRPNVKRALPTWMLTYCFPLTEYVIGPAATEEPRLVCQSNLPSRASSA